MDMLKIAYELGLLRALRDARIELDDVRKFAEEAEKPPQKTQEFMSPKDSQTTIQKTFGRFRVAKGSKLEKPDEKGIKR